MKLRPLLLPLVLAAMSWVLPPLGAAAQSPTAGTTLATGLLSPRGLKIGPDGMIYVAEAGSGGETALKVEGTEHRVGPTGRISKVDPATGTRTTVVDGLPSDFEVATNDAVGPADVAFLDGELYYLQTHGGVYGAPGTPTGVYRVNDDGSTALVANIGKFTDDNPVEDVTAARQQDVEPGGNVYAMVVRDGAFYVTDGNQNQLMRVELDGTITRIAEFDNHPVTTGLATQASGPMYVANLGAFPFAPEDGTVYRIGLPTGSTTEIASGVSALTDVEFGPGGTLYALSFASQDADFSSGSPFEPFSGGIARVDADGTLTPLVTGLNFATALIFDGDTAYVANNGNSIAARAEGEIVQIENFSSLEPLAPAPAPQPRAAPAPAPATPVGVITAPDTGTGDGTARDGMTLWFAIALGVAGAVAAGASVVVARR